MLPLFWIWVFFNWTRIVHTYVTCLVVELANACGSHPGVASSFPLLAKSFEDFFLLNIVRLFITRECFSFLKKYLNDVTMCIKNLSNDKFNKYIHELLETFYARLCYGIAQPNSNKY